MKIFYLFELLINELSKITHCSRDCVDFFEALLCKKAKLFILNFKYEFSLSKDLIWLTLSFYHPFWVNRSKFKSNSILSLRKGNPYILYGRQNPDAWKIFIFAKVLETKFIEFFHGFFDTILNWIFLQID